MKYFTFENTDKIKKYLLIFLVSIFMLGCTKAYNENDLEKLGIPQPKQVNITETKRIIEIITKVALLDMSREDMLNKVKIYYNIKTKAAWIDASTLNFTATEAMELECRISNSLPLKSSNNIEERRLFQAERDECSSFAPSPLMRQYKTFLQNNAIYKG